MKSNGQDKFCASAELAVPLLWTCGMQWSSRKRNIIPAQKPTTAGTKANLPIPEAWSIAGISRLQIEAATITPAAKPESEFSALALIPPLKK